MRDLLFAARMAYLNWRMRERTCLTGCGSTGLQYAKSSHGKPVFCSSDCREQWHQTMNEY